MLIHCTVYSHKECTTMLTKLAPHIRKQHFATIQCDQPYLYFLPFSNKISQAQNGMASIIMDVSLEGKIKNQAGIQHYLSFSTGPLAYISSLECLSFDRQSAGTYAYPFGSLEFFIDASSDVITSSFPNVSACCNCKERLKKFSH